MTIYAVEVTNTTTLPFLLAIFTLIGGFATKLLAAWQAKGENKTNQDRVVQVEAPTAAADAFVKVFEVSQRLTLSLQADIARMEKRLDDQDEEHRIELAERDSRYAELHILQNETAGSLRRLRSYVVVVTNLLNEHGIAFPPMPDEDMAPERRLPTTVTTVPVTSKEI